MMKGIIAVWKPAGMTSHDLVFKLRKLLGIKKIGHTGTLDPEVEGVLLVCIGQATKLIEFLMEGHKVYRGSMLLGESRDTEDQTGQVLESQAVTEPVSSEAIDQAMASLTGKIQQVAPLYSAVKVDGKRLYEYARQRIEVERPVRQATIYQFQQTAETVYDPDQQTQTIYYEVDCSKGTYVRTLCVDLGKRLGYPAHLTQLVRYATGGFNQDQALTLEEIAEAVDSGRLEEILYPMEAAVADFPRIDLTDQDYEEVRYGKVLPADYFQQRLSETTALFYQDRLLALYYPHPDKPGLIKPRKMFID